MGAIFIIGFGAIGFIAWAIAQRYTNEVPSRRSFQPTEPTINDTVRR